MADIKEKYLRDLGSEIVNEGVHLIQVSLFSKRNYEVNFAEKILEGTYQVVGRISNILKTKEMFFQQVKMLENSF